MSGAELIAVLSVGASVIQVIDACNKLADRIKEYRSNAAFIRLRSQLQLFASNIKALEKTTRVGEEEEEETLLREVLDGCKLRIEELDSLVISLLPGPKSSTFNKTMHAVRAFFKDSRVKAILDDLNDYREVILLHICRETEQNTRKLLFLFEEQHMARQAQQNQQNDAPTAQSMLDVNSATVPSMAQDRFQIALRSPRQRKRDNGNFCALGECTCSCHRMSRRVLSVWSFTEPVTCNCRGGRYVTSVKVLGKCVQFNLGASWANGLSFACSLNFKNIVNEDNPGFAVIKRCLVDEVTFEEALVELKTLRRCGVIDFEDSTEDDQGYLELLSSRRLAKENHRSKVQLAKFLTDEGVTWKSTNTYGYAFDLDGPQLDLLRCLPPIDNPGLWHRCFPPHADQWLLKAFTRICLSQIDIGQYKPLHHAVAIGSLDEIKRCLKRHQRVDLTQNFLKQTVLHLAVQWPSILDYLLKSGYGLGINWQNAHGATPLCYALRYGYLDSIKILVEAGAKFPQIKVPYGYAQSSLSYAAAAPDERPLLHLLDHLIRKTPPSRVSIEILEPMVFISAYPGAWNLKAVDYLSSKMTAFAEEHPHRYERGGLNPLHYASSSQHAQALLGYSGFDINTSSNEPGFTPLMSFAWFLDPDLMQKALARGAQINDADYRGQTALHCAFKAVYSSGEPDEVTLDTELFLRMMETAAVLILAGADLSQKDNCRCYCSPQGCSPMRALAPARIFGRGHHIRLVWVFELFIILQSCEKDELIPSLIEEMDRYQRSDEIGITHTCCCTSTCAALKYWPPFERPYVYKLMLDKGDYYRHSEIQELNQVYEDWEEIRDEESELGASLEQDRPLSEGDWEVRLVKILARRCAIWERMETKRNVVPNSSRDYGPSKPLELESHIKDYILSMENRRGYMKSAMPGYDHEYCMQQRKRLSTLLIDEYRRVRPLIYEGHDSGVENWVEGHHMESFRTRDPNRALSMTWYPQSLY